MAFSQPRAESRFLIVDDMLCQTIPLTQDKEAIVDIEDYPYLSKWIWVACKRRHTYYAFRRVHPGNNGVFMHTEILGLARPDHKNGNGLDNRRRNLRPATISQNSANGRMRQNNKLGLRGVYYHPQGCRSKPYRAEIMVNGNRLFLGYYGDPRVAARAYDWAAIESFGEFARTNFPVSDYESGSIGVQGVCP